MYYHQEPCVINDQATHHIDWPQPNAYQRYGKRLLDLTLTIPALILLAPLLLVVALLVRLKLGAPILFRQQRPGWHGQPFTMYKFRTMLDARDADGRPLSDAERLRSDAERLTPFGKWLRSTSLDELPELFNVLRGEMSLVGPRPLLMHYLERYTPEQMRRHAVRPGISGWAQVNGRNALTWEDKFALDVWYADHVSLGLDIRIMCMTIWKIVRREGIAQAGQATMAEFQGTPATMQRVVIIGAGGHAQVVADSLLRMRDAGTPVVPIGYLDDNPTLRGTTRLGLPVLGNLDDLAQIAHDAVIVAIGNNHVRRCIFEQLQQQGETFAVARHPAAVIAPDVCIGPGTMICAGVVVNPGSVIGANVILNTGCTVDHHNQIQDHVHIAPGAHLGGDVQVGFETLIGIGATVMPQCRVGAGSVVGAAALVRTHVPERVVMVGVPARMLRRTTAHALADAA